jgi:putative DNA methylase
VHKRKLIEVALPLEAINRESAREKSIRHGHPSTLHLWWARRPLAAARAVLFAQLVDDPSARPEEFPTEELQRAERARLHDLIERLVVWENIRDEKLLAEAHAEIVRSTDGDVPPVLDPFAGGGTIPFEAQRLGLKSNASDLNPVAVLINKALIEIPPRFRGTPPVFPKLAGSQIRSWEGVEGLVADVRAYGDWMRDEAEKRIGHLYPKATLSGGVAANVIAWIWARTVPCPNPACGIEMPLVRSWWVSKKRGKEAYLSPELVADSGHSSGQRVSFKVHDGAGGGPGKADDGTVGRTGARCVACGTSVPLAYVREAGRNRKMGTTMLALVAEANRQRIFLPATQEHVEAAGIPAPDEAIAGSLGFYPRDLKAVTYGLTDFADLFTPRQLTALATFSDLVGSARAKVVSDGGSEAYADAVATYLGLGVSRLADIANALCGWENTKTQVRHLFTRQAIPMMWDFAEAPPFGQAAGSFQVSLGSLSKAIVDSGGPEGRVEQQDAATRDYTGVVVSTDPPYYDNIGYSDLSDFFYVWLRRTLKAVYPELLSTMQVPKAEELVANPYRHGGKVEAKDFFEDGFRSVFARVRESARTDIPMTVWYAFKQSDSDDGSEASTGWETLLEGMIRSGWEITSTWPSRSEMSNRMMAKDMNALASSIVLSLRPRPEGSPTTDRRGFITALEEELPGALRKLQQGRIAPVDLPQAAIGPGMAVFSRYAAVLEPNGKKMTVRAALARINEILDQVLNEQEGDFDSTSRFAIAWYRQHGYGIGKFGDADNLARARNTSVEVMDRDAILTSRAGNVQLIKSSELLRDYDVLKDTHTSNWEALHHVIKVLERDGIAPAGDFLQAALTRPDGAIAADLVKELAHLLFRIAEGNGWTKDALSFNNLVTSWPEILDAARSTRKATAKQDAFNFDGGDES